MSRNSNKIIPTPFYEESGVKKVCTCCGTSVEANELQRKRAKKAVNVEVEVPNAQPV